jgi:hypothetical protein
VGRFESWHPVPQNGVKRGKCANLQVQVVSRLRQEEGIADQVLRCGDEDRVDAFVVQQMAVIEVGLRAGSDGACVFQALGQASA